MFGAVRPGYDLLRINDEPVLDNLDCLYKLTEDFVRLEFKDKSGNIVKFQFPNESYSTLGLNFEPDKVKICRNKCVFCFVHQQPKGMRRALYVRDDDYRFSFTHGNFITFSNLSDGDVERIIEQRLSPLYLSIHSTDDALRQKLFGNKKLPPILPQLKYLTEHNINFHTQIVLCPDLNDGSHLEKTVNDLSALYPGVASLGIVPVGLTRYRDRLPKLKHYTKAGAEHVIDTVHQFQREILSSCGSRFIYAADEFYIQAEREFPRLSEYEDMPQFENGIGMIRMFLTDFNRKKRFLKYIKSNRRLMIITGVSAYDILNEKIILPLKENTGLNIDIFQVKNRFWGKYVTVSGLLTGRDILSQLKSIGKKFDNVILPPNCINNDGLFLDDMTIDELSRKSGMPISIGSYSMVDTLKEVLN